jgi:uncharacterized membrane protein YbaN (DUF454 family)
VAGQEEKLKKHILIAVGFVAVTLGTIGMFLPLIPTVPFLLLAAWCFAGSSERFHKWLLNHRLFGEYIRNYKEKKGMLLRHKIQSLAVLWLGIGYSFFFAMKDIDPDKLFYIRIFLALVLVGVTTHLLLLKTVKNDK